MTTNEIVLPFPPAEKNWADRLFIAGLGIYAFSCSFSIAASQIGLSLALIAFIALYRAGKVTIKATGFDQPYAFLVLAGILATFRAELPQRALSELKSFLLIFCFYLAYWPDMSSKLKDALVWLYFASASIVATLTCAKSFTLSPEGAHAQGFFSTSLTFGECQALAALTMVYFIVSKSHSLKAKLLLLTALTSTVTALILSFTRGAWIGFVVGLLVLATGFPRKILPLILLCCLLTVGITVTSPLMRERLAGLDITRTLATADKNPDQKFESVAAMSSYHRLYIWQRGYLMLAGNSAFGIGAKNIKHHYNLLANDYEHKNGLIWSHQHNNFMQMLVIYGPLGLIAFFYFIITMFKFIGICCNNSSATNYKIKLGSSAVFLCFLVFGLTEHAWGDEEVGMMAFFLTGLLLSQHRKTESQA